MAPPEPRTLRFGVVPGAMPGKWVERWRERMPHVTLEMIEIPVADQRRALADEQVDVALVREPFDRTDMHAVALYEEQAVVVMSVDSDLTVAETLDADDLAGEVLVIPGDDVLGDPRVPGTLEPAFPRIPDTEATIATVATGVGITIVPMSLARLHHRKDVTFRPLTGGPVSPVLLAWLQRKDSEDIQAFVGITRGRTARSSR
ncbi:LysR family substrate-binding domain-containing protein [Brevibacterium litoralis]|uniref:LysR family substrate-binding domain-containing protein n=1 Tax=Brevibacterium litoralis TaxID=3138935 RepID=UPI0032EE4735